MEIDKLTVREIKDGYRFDAAKAIKVHVDTEHESKFEELLYSESKYNTFTDNQKKLLSLMYSDLTDKEIATRLEVSPSTVRHQRFMFREKAKQAKMYLAVYEQVIERKSSPEEMNEVTMKFDFNYLYLQN